MSKYVNPLNAKFIKWSNKLNKFFMEDVLYGKLHESEGLL